MSLQRLLNAPWPDPDDLPGMVRYQADQRIHSYWQSRGWQLVLGELILWYAAHNSHAQHPDSYGVLAAFILLAYLLGLLRPIRFLWLILMVILLTWHGMLVNGLGAVTALSFMLPYTFAAMLLPHRRRIIVQACCVVAFWFNLLYEVLPIFPQLFAPRSILVSYNILIAAFTFQSLRFLNTLAVDLTSTHVAEQVRGQSQQFLARVSHELRTPLNSILGFAKMLNRTPLEEKQQTYLQQIIDEGEQLNRLVSDLLDSAHLSTGKLTLNKAPCDVNAICETVAAEHRPHLKPSVSLTVSLQPDLPPLTADKIRLRQAISNLAPNAIKHTEKGEIHLRSICENQHILVEVKDTGSGIPEDKQEIIFVPFVQLDEQKVGVGLGLDIARQLARLHSGDITVKSDVGQGSTFTLELPIE